jgi:FAD/FMN-containing dehydrogenase
LAEDGITEDVMQAVEELGRALEAAVGTGQVFAGAAIGERYRTDMSRKYAAEPAFLVRPASAEEVSAVVRAAAAHGRPITVVGGQTGTCGAAVPAPGGVALSLERMSRVLEIDPVALTMTVEAGCVLQAAQEAAEAAGLLLPLDLGSRGSATIGGVIGANAGGNRVLRWGMTRDMVVGLEAVLADGAVVSSLTKMIKDNAGYNWKHLLIGSEGTLGIVTRAVLRLRPAPTTRQTALVAAASFDDAVAILHRLGGALSGRLSSFELMWGDFYRRMTEAQLDRRPRPMVADHALYALVEAMGGDAESDAAQFERALAGLLEEGVVQDAVIASSQREAEALWAIREDLAGGLAPLRPFASYDVSMSLGDMPGVVRAIERDLVARFPEVQILFYGHAGDGNLHAVVSVGRMDPGIQRAFDETVFGAVRAVGGSIAAEHGVGVSRAPFLSWTRTPAELELMRTLKRALDPQDILNRGKLLDAM